MSHFIRRCGRGASNRVVSFLVAASFIERISVLKRNILGAPFEQCFEALQNGNASTLAPVQIPYRRNETIYVLPQADRIVIVYSVCFEDKTDQAIARIFLQVRSTTSVDGLVGLPPRVKRN
jgi:hypothetical protein